MSTAPEANTLSPEQCRALLAAALELLTTASSLIDALTTHIYEDEDEIPDDCGYKGCVEQIDELTPRIAAFLNPPQQPLIRASLLDIAG